MEKIKYTISADDVFVGKDGKYHYFYKITNILNNKYYLGVHNTLKIDDGYAGSGHLLKQEMKVSGVTNYHKEIIKFFDSKDDAFDFEEKQVTLAEVKNCDCYNQHCGGSGSWDFTIGRVTVKDKDGNTFMIDKNNPDYLNGLLVSNMKGLVHVIDNKGEKITITTKEYYRNKNKYKAHNADYVIAKKTNGEVTRVKSNDYAKLKEQGLVCGQTKGKGVFKNENNEYVMCDINDPRIAKGELVGATKGLTLYKYKNDFSKLCFTTTDDERVKNGTLVGINFGVIHCRNVKTGEKITVLKDDRRLANGEIVPANKYFNTIKRLNGAIISNNKTPKTKEDYELEYPEAVQMLIENQFSTDDIANKTGLTKDKVRYLKGRLKKLAVI